MSGGWREPVFNWTDENVAEAKRLRDSGLSFGDVAWEIGCPSRNAVIGKLKRLGSVSPPGVSKANQAKSREQWRGKPRKVKQGNGEMWNGGAWRRHVNERFKAEEDKKRDPGIKEVPATVDDLAIPESQRKTLLELEHHHCRWPVGDPGDPGFFFCGGEARDGPYCPHHARRARFA